MKKITLIITMILIFDTAWTQEQAWNQPIEQLEHSVTTLQDTLREMSEGQRMREADMVNREVLILRLRYKMELISRLTDEQFVAVLLELARDAQELEGDTLVSRAVYMAYLPILEWSIRADITQSAAEISANMMIEEIISATERKLGVN